MANVAHKGIKMLLGEFAINILVWNCAIFICVSRLNRVKVLPTSNNHEQITELRHWQNNF